MIQETNSKEIYDAIHNKTFKKNMDSAIAAMKQNKFSDRLDFFKYWKNIIDTKSKVGWEEKNKKWEIKKKKN